MTRDRRVVLEVLEALAAAEGVEPHELDYSLQEHVDTDSLERLAEMEDAEWTLTFSVPDHEVTVDSDGGILVDGEAAASDEVDQLER
ncbi:HalOD1 output domain-containing protein [Halostella salina]|uniref:HalOD1 output domain-containing protein n=1 Tax=Halostella salina TaxID=1547897 RepID=UPI000EF7C3EA|nr:HalOD1 output domain-containing protein [Halostella salina]